MNIDRRQFLTSAIVGAGGMILARSAFSAEPAAAAVAAPANPFEIVPLGKTGLKVSRIGCGTGMRGGGRQTNQTRLGKEKFEALLRYAYDKGIRFFDCADMYGTHPYLASALKAVPRESYVISTKIWVRRGGLPETERPDANILLDRFRKELNTDYVDLVLIHCMDDPNWCDRQKRQMDIMADLKAKGVIRAHGVSVHSLGALRAAAASAWVDSIHVRINAYGDRMDASPQIVAPIVKQMHEAGKGVVAMKLIAEGDYRDDPLKRDESIKYVLGLSAVDTLAVGFEKPEEIDDFAARLTKAMQAKAAG